MQMKEVQASHLAKQGALQAAIDSLQERANLLHRRHQQWASQLACLLHWKRQGAQQLRRVLHSWARLSARSESHLSLASQKHFPRGCCGASGTEGEDDPLAVGACQGAYLAVDQGEEEVPCQARLGGEAGVHVLRLATDHHDRRLLGVCFRGTHACGL